MKTSIIVLFGLVLPGVVVPNPEVKESDVKMIFYNRGDAKHGIAFNRTNTKQLENTSFSPSKHTYIFIHGWMNNNKSDFAKTVTEPVVAYDDNIFFAEWSPIAKKSYLVASNSVQQVGKIVATIIKVLISKYGLLLSKLTLVGHSLGAHVCGSVGANLKGKVCKIVGLDAAGPLFEGTSREKRVDTSDTKCLIAIHTNGGVEGYLRSYGHTDIYPNGGSLQPGCGVSATCSHGAAHKLFAECISKNSTEKFIMRRCESNEKFSEGECNSNPTSDMCTKNTDKCACTVPGNYYLYTNGESPYAKGIKGAKGKKKSWFNLFS